ncbi:MAG: PqqD family protein [Hydrococcus sp. SU_1_0]|nr:PqqD family protein [Hydrococcus sp. SU_1_0]
MLQQLSVAYQASSDNLYSEIDSEAVVLDLESGVYYGLNETGNQIWQWLQQPKTESEIIALVLDEYDVEPEQGANDVKALLQEMTEAKIVRLVDVVEDEKAAI